MSRHKKEARAGGHRSRAQDKTLQPYNISYF